MPGNEATDDYGSGVRLYSNMKSSTELHGIFKTNRTRFLSVDLLASSVLHCTDEPDAKVHIRSPLWWDPCITEAISVCLQPPIHYCLAILNMFRYEIMACHNL